MRAVITLAGDGSRMLPWSQALRKEFLPVFAPGLLPPTLKPVAHLAVESVVRAGAESVTLVVRPDDRPTIERSFAVSAAYADRHRHHPERLRESRRLGRLVRRARLLYAVQRRPLGFGDAVLRARPSVGRSPFWLHAGDGAILSARPEEVLRRMARLREREALDAVLLVRRVADPRRYGVIEGRRAAPVDGVPRIDVERMEEKPARPRSPWAATAVYAFAPTIFDALDRVRRTARPAELEVTDGIRSLLAAGGRVAALALPARLGAWGSVGSPDSFYRTLRASRRLVDA